MSQELQDKIQLYQEDYLNTPAGQKHLATVEAEFQEVQKVFADLRQKYEAGEDITEDVLRHLLPHSDTQHNRAHSYRVSTWPCITKDIRTWFENTGWKEPEDWPETARMIFEALDGILRDDKRPWQAFLTSRYRRGFGTGFLSPILFCLDDQRFAVINSKVVKTYKYCTAQLDNPDNIDAKLDNYLQNVQKVRALQQQLAPFGLRSLPEFDIFCHFMVSKRLGGGDLTKVQDPDYAAWLFVANPTIFKWDRAFRDKGVEWTGALGSYAQKLLRRKIKAGDRVFGYQTGPDYEVQCELSVDTAPHKTPQGTWAVNLSPVHIFDQPISLSTLKAHPILSSLKFIQQAQMSITGITETQLEALQALLAVPPSAPSMPNTIDALCKALRHAQHDTSHPNSLEKHLAETFNVLGLEADHQGGSGNADVVVVGQLGAETYTAIVEAKTCPKGKTVGLAQVNYPSISDHKEENMADYALLVAPAFAGGKLSDHAIKNTVGMITVKTLITLLKHHDQFPFSIAELRALFATQGPADDVAEKLGRVHAQHTEYLELVNEVLQIFDDLQRKQDASEPIPSLAIHLILLQKAQSQSLPPPNLKQIDHILAFLANPILDLLTPQGDGYVLTLSVPAARHRLLALADFVTMEVV